jgi:phosphoadenosine phosphosulfate reductase
MIDSGKHNKTLENRLKQFRNSIDGAIVFTTSFGIEDQVITHALVSGKLDIMIVTLDTGRLFQETLDVWSKTESRYDVRISSVSPDAEKVSELIENQGVLGFRENIENRKTCCHVRKVKPLEKALDGAMGWVTGLRSEQSQNRQDVKLELRDENYNLIKLNPLYDWSRDQVLDYVSDNSVPYNILHDQGFHSIGCQPCTRAVASGEPERSGRWWWERKGSSECGLHINEDGKIVRDYTG